MLSLARNALRPRLAPVLLQAYRNAACDAKKVNPKFAKIAKLQEKFQKKDGLPIFLKGGASDKILYRTTWLLCIVGLLLNVKLYLHYLLK